MVINLVRSTLPQRQIKNFSQVVKSNNVIWTMATGKHVRVNIRPRRVDFVNVRELLLKNGISLKTPLTPKELKAIEGLPVDVVEFSKERPELHIDVQSLLAGKKLMDIFSVSMPQVERFLHICELGKRNSGEAKLWSLTQGSFILVGKSFVDVFRANVERSTHEGRRMPKRQVLTNGIIEEFVFDLNIKNGQ